MEFLEDGPGTVPERSQSGHTSGLEERSPEPKSKQISRNSSCLSFVLYPQQNSEKDGHDRHRVPGPSCAVFSPERSRNGPRPKMNVLQSQTCFRGSQNGPWACGTASEGPGKSHSTILQRSRNGPRGTGYF